MSELGTRRLIGRFAVCAIVWLGGALPAAASPFGTIGVDSRGIAMGVGTAVAEGPSAVYYNPSRLVGGTTTTDILLGAQYTDLGLRINGENIDEEEIASTFLGFTHPTNLLGFDVAVGGMISIPFQRVSRLLTLPLDQPQFLYFGTRNQRLVVMLAAGVEVTDWLSIGGGVQTLLDAFSEPDFVLVSDPDSTNDGTPADALEAQSFGFASAVQDPILAPVLGLELRPMTGVTIGATYRAEIAGRVSAPFVVSIEEVDVFGLTLADSRFVLPNEAEIFFSPNEVSVGLAYESAESDLLVSLDVTWSQWSKFPATFSDALPEFTGGLSEIILPVPTFDPIKPPSRDVVVPALGIEWLAHEDDGMDLMLRGGYSYRRAMVDEDRGTSNYLDNDTHLVGAGLGVTFRDWSRFFLQPITLNAHFQAQVLEKRTVTKEDPGSSPFGDLETGGLLLGGGLEAMVRF